MSEAELFERLAEDRLRKRAIWAGAAIALSVAWPYEVVDERPQFLWQIVGELPLGGVVAAAAPAVGGVTIMAAGRLCKRGASLAIVVIAALVAAGITRRLGAEASAWGLLPMPQSFTDQAAFALVALAATAAGSNLSHRRATRPASRVLLVSAVLFCLVFYGWPGRGEAPGETVLRSLLLVGDMPTFRHQLGLVTLAVVALWPALLALLGLIHLRRPARQAFSALGMTALFGFPVILMMLLFSWYMRASPGAALFGAFGAALEISAVLALLAAAAEVLAEHVTTQEGDEGTGWSVRRPAIAAVTILVIVTGAQWWLSRPPHKGVSWQLEAPTAEADHLFGELVVQWSDARWTWDRRVRRDSSATEMIEVRARARDLVEAAEAVDPALGEAFEALTRAARDLDTPSRRWYRLVRDVNAATRRTGLPYYLDPRVSVGKSGEGLVRHFVVDSYRVARVRRWTVGDTPFATLHVQALGTLRAGHRLGLLGFSRDQQPFALVVLDAGETHLHDLREMVASEPPRCGETFSGAADAVSRRCGAALEAMLARRDASDAVIASVERHELQHQIDGPLLRLAEPVRRKLAGYTDRAIERANRELSAYVAQLTVEASPVHIGLVLPFRFALLTDRGTYHHAAVLTLEALGGRSIRDDRGAVNVQALGSTFDELAALDDDALRERARRAWESLFGDELPPARLIEEVVAPPVPSSSTKPEE
ncbi:MAG TPA: hypothetical protein ENK57_01555, partial [Polyangiaceae bacterium]|nr:hypothetical protein [Polyangiaceae bacterium]